MDHRSVSEGSFRDCNNVPRLEENWIHRCNWLPGLALLHEANVGRCPQGLGCQRAARRCVSPGRSRVSANRRIAAKWLTPTDAISYHALGCGPVCLNAYACGCRL